MVKHSSSRTRQLFVLRNRSVPIQPSKLNQPYIYIFVDNKCSFVLDRSINLVIFFDPCIYVVPRFFVATLLIFDLNMVNLFQIFFEYIFLFLSVFEESDKKEKDHKTD